MRFTISLLVSLSVLALVYTQEGKIKGEECLNNNECDSTLKCIEGHCDCRIGHFPQFESHAQGGSNPRPDQGVFVCKKVIGHACNHDAECYDHLPNAKCDPNQHVCVCNKEDGCTDAGMSLTVMSLTTMMAVVVSIIKVW